MCHRREGPPCCAANYHLDSARRRLDYEFTGTVSGAAALASRLPAQCPARLWEAGIEPVQWRLVKVSLINLQIFWSPVIRSNVPHMVFFNYGFPFA